MNYEFDELTAQVVRTAGFRERYRGYDPADVDPLLERLAADLDEVHDELIRLERRMRSPRARRGAASVADVAALAALLHIGYAAREARAIVTTARKRTGLNRAKSERQQANEGRARALLHAARPEEIGDPASLG